MTSPWQPPDQSVTETPLRAQPQYGEMAPPGYVSPVPPPPAAPDYSAPTYYIAPPVNRKSVIRKSRTADVAITSALLALGLVGMFIGLSVGLTLHQSLSSEAAKYGVTYTDPGNLGGLAAFIAVSHVLLFLAALGISLPLLITRRLAFWVPLVAGVVAAIILWVILISLIVGDQPLMDAISASR